MNQKTLFNDLHAQYNEMLRFLINYGYIVNTKEGYKWADCGQFLGERTDFKREPNCPDCGRRHSSRMDGCDMVYGRRGWRQLGSYDG